MLCILGLMCYWRYAGQVRQGSIPITTLDPAVAARVANSLRSVSSKVLRKSSKRGSFQGEATMEEMAEPSYAGSRLDRAQSRLDEARESVERARESARERRASRASRRMSESPQFSAPEDVEMETAPGSGSQRSSDLGRNPFSGAGSQRFRVSRDDLEMQAEVRGSSAVPGVGEGVGEGFESELASPSMLERARQLKV